MSGENTAAEFSAPLLLEAEGWQDYRLLDSGDGRKLGPYGFIRPEAQALWPAALMPLNGRRLMANLSQVLPGVNGKKAKPANGSCVMACLLNGQYNLKT